MKPLITLLTILSFWTASFAQNSDKTLNTIDVQGFSKLIANPDYYIAQILIQEEEQKAGYTTIGKLSIDSIKTNLVSTLSRFGIDQKDLKILGTSSREIGQYPNFLINISYEVKLKNKEIANKLVNEVRFVGLKGIVVKRVFTISKKEALTDSLYNEALKDAKRTANELAKKTNKTLGEIKSIESRGGTFFPDIENNTESYNAFSMNKFEMDYRDRYASCSIRVIFELK